MRARVQIKPVQACVRAQVRLQLESCCVIVRVRFGVWGSEWETGVIQYTFPVGEWGWS